MHPLYHAKSSTKKYGGESSDYLPLHQWMDQTKAHIADSRHRMLLHNSFGIFLGEQVFGVSMKRESDGKELAVRPILEQHVIEDLGFIPSVSECFSSMTLEGWMYRRGEKPNIKEEPMSKQRPNVVCLCGSTRFSAAFREENLHETLAGNIVLSIGCDFKSDTDLLLAGELAPEDKERLDELHLRKIDLADEVLILNVGGYIGSSTARELRYAQEHGKRVRFLETIGRGELNADDGTAEDKSRE